MRALATTHLRAFLLAPLLALVPTLATAQTGAIKIMAVGDSITEGFTPADANGDVPGTPSYRQEFTNLLSTGGCDFEMVGRKTTNYLGNNPQNVFNGNSEGYSGQRANHIRDSLNWDFTNNTFVQGFRTWSNPGISQMMQTNTPDVVLLHIGTNDIFSGQSVSGISTEIDQIIQAIHGHNSNTIVIVANVIPSYANSNNNPNANQSVTQLANLIEATYDDPGNPVANVYVADVNSDYNPSLMQDDGIHPNSEGEEHIANAFYEVYNNVMQCSGVPVEPIDIIAPETFIAVPAANQTVDGTTTFRGNAIDTGGSGINRVQVAIQNTATSQWYNFSDGPDGGTFGPISIRGNDIGITNANLAGASDSNKDWNIEVTLPAGDYLFLALAYDNEENSEYSGRGLWPVQRSFSSTAAADNTPPTVAIAPFNADPALPFSSESITIQGTAEDAGGAGLLHLRLLIRDTTTLEFIAPDGSRNTAWSPSLEHRIDFSNSPDTANWSIPLDPAIIGLSSGSSYSVHALPVDTAHNNNSTWPWTVTSFIFSDGTIGDNVSPTITFNNPSVAAETLLSPVTIQGTAEDTGGAGLLHLRLLIRDTTTLEFIAPDGSRNTAWSPGLEHRIDFPNSPDTANWSIPLDPAIIGLSSGSSYSVHALPVDTAHNNNSTWPWTVTSFIFSDNTVGDNVSPTITFNSPSVAAETLLSPVTIQGTAEDTGGAGLLHLRLLIRDITTLEFIAPDGSRNTAWSPSLEHRINFPNSPDTANWSIPLDPAIIGFSSGSSYSVHALPVDTAHNNNSTWPWTVTSFELQ